MSQKVGIVKRLVSSPRGMTIGMSLWPPYLAAGVRVEGFSPDFRSVRVRLNKRPWTTNYVGTAFGGSMFSMSDPFWMFMLLQHLGRDHVVWGVKGEIDFRAPGTSTLHAEFSISDADLAEIRAAAAGGEKVLRWFTTDITDDDGVVVATVRKQIYVRRKRDAATRTAVR